MKLNNPFSDKTRVLFMDTTACFFPKCKSNQGLELHHIYGRTSNSPFNGAVVCNECHSHIKHNEEEHRLLLTQTMIFLFLSGYTPTPDDHDFFQSIKRDFDFVSQYILAPDLSTE